MQKKGTQFGAITALVRAYQGLQGCTWSDERDHGVRLETIGLASPGSFNFHGGHSGL